MLRIAVLERDRCKPKDCGKACYRNCPMVRSKVEAIRFEDEAGKPAVVEALCSGCGICVKKCPCSALIIVNLPSELEGDCSHRYGSNSFQLFRLPMPQEGFVLGLIGRNGVGKTTAIRILAGEIKPNLGKFEGEPSWRDVISRYRGTLIQEYLSKLSAGKLKVSYKPQYLDHLLLEGVTAGEFLEESDERGKARELVDRFGLTEILDRELKILSGGELQRIAIAACICREADSYLLDEPSSFLDVKQRLEVAKAIQTLKEDGKTVVVAEHDLAILDYLSDQVCLLYGEPGAYGIVSHPHGVRVGINIYLQGFIPDENMRIRDEAVTFPTRAPSTVWKAEEVVMKWGKLEKSYNGFTLEVEPGEAGRGEVIGILGPNATGKTTFVKLLAGIEKPNKGRRRLKTGLKISYKPQYPSTAYQGTVESLLREVVGDEYEASWFHSEVVQPLNIQRILDKRADELSGGELQRVAIATCLARKADIYLLDEPSAYLDVEERLAMARAIRRIVEGRGVTAFVVEHDVVTEDFIADKLMVFSGEPGRRGEASSPMGFRDGMNVFLKEVGVTFRRDKVTRRPRVNKPGSILDKEQKARDEYYSPE